MSWHLSVPSVVWVPSPWLPRFQRPLMAPVCASVKMRGLETIFASSGCASGTLMMSILNNEVSGLAVGFPARAACQFFRLTNGSGAGDIDVDVVLIFGVDHERMRVGAAAALHGGDLLRIREVADIEDAHAAEPVRVGRRKRTRRTLRLDSGFGGRGRRQAGAGHNRPAAELPGCRSRAAHSPLPPT